MYIYIYIYKICMLFESPVWGKVAAGEQIAGRGFGLARALARGPCTLTGAISVRFPVYDLGSISAHIYI